MTQRKRTNFKSMALKMMSRDSLVFNGERNTQKKYLRRLDWKQHRNLCFSLIVHENLFCSPHSTLCDDVGVRCVNHTESDYIFHVELRVHWLWERFQFFPFLKKASIFLFPLFNLKHNTSQLCVKKRINKIDITFHYLLLFLISFSWHAARYLSFHKKKLSVYCENCV